MCHFGINIVDKKVHKWYNDKVKKGKIK